MPGPRVRARAAHVRPEGPIMAVRSQILSHEDDLSCLEGFDLGQDRVERPRSLLATKRRDRTEPAPAVAAFGNLDVGPRRARRRARGAPAGRSCSTRSPSPRRLVAGAHDPPRGLHLDRHAKPCDEVDLADRRRQLLAGALGEASGHDEPGAVASHGVQLQDRLDRLLASGLDERAGVHHDEVGIAGIVRPLVAAGGQPTDQLLVNRRRSSGSRES